MAETMLGVEVAKAMKIQIIEKVEAWKAKGVVPNLTIIRVGAREDDLAYERGAKKRMELTGIDCKVLELPEDISQEDLEIKFRQVNDDPKVHGILLFRPLPKHLDEEPLRMIINPYKDVDGMSPVNMAKVFSGDASGHAPCTAEAVMEMLDYYKIDLTGKKVAIVGRSMVVGRPLAMLMLKKNATVTICHTKTKDLPGTLREAQVLVAAAGKAKMITEDMVGEAAIVADVGINVDENGNLCGDVDYERAEKKASYISPVPRGVGSVTTSVLAKHVVSGLELLAKENQI